MPGPHNAAKTARRPEVRDKDGGVDIGKQTGQFDTSNVRQKVRTWQTQGGGVAPQDDVIVVEYEDEEPRRKVRDQKPRKMHVDRPDQARGTDSEDNARRISPTKSGRPSTSKSPGPLTQAQIDSERQAWVRRKSKPNTDLDDELKHVGAPKKRVVSDGHWRKDRNPPKKVTSVPKTDPKPFTIKRTVVYTGGEQSTKVNDDDGIRVRPMKHVSDHRSREHLGSDRPRTPKEGNKTTRGGSDNNFSGPDRDSDHSAKRGSYGHDTRRQYKSKYRDASPPEDGSNGPSIAPDDSISKRNGHSQKLRNSPREKTASKHSRRSTSPPLVQPAKEAECPPAAPPKVYRNRIEAWLTETPSDAKEVDDNASDAPLKPTSNNAGRAPRKSSYDSSIYGASKADSRRRPPPIDEDAVSVATSSVPPTVVDIPEDNLKKHAPGANLRRHFPSTGKRLSTIASVETLESRRQSPAPSEISEQATIVPDTESRAGSGSGLKRRLTRHDDLMSVLSLPRAETKSMMSSRSIRTSRTRRDNVTAKDLWDELAGDEAKYQRELRTVVDGVIPVLLSCVLSKSDSSVAAGLFGRAAPSESTVTKPIVDMGIALERLKAHHRRIPSRDESNLFTWAQGATRIYSDYLKAWRMGFQDVVVNLAPGNESPRNAWDDGLLKNEAGDIVNTDGERVDVAFLLKRPLVRLKYLAKTFKSFNHIQPSASADAIAEKYQQLVVEARVRVNEERARLEDEAAASIDPTRARDLRSMAPLAGVGIDPTRCVRARDYFDMELRHSSGQQLDCKIELVLRDDCVERGNSGDILLCEVSDAGRWLLFPPLRQELVSARNGHGPGEIIIMVRGMQPDGREWHELLSLHANEDEAAPEWIQMLGLEPVPPSLSRLPSFLAPSQSRPGSRTATPTKANMSLLSRSPPPKDIEVPIGEVASNVSNVWTNDDTASYVSSDLTNDGSPLRQSGTVHRKPVPKSYNTQNSPLRELFSSIDSALSDSVSLSETSPPGLRRAKARKHRSSPLSPTLSQKTASTHSDRPEPLRTARPTHSRTQSEVTWMSSESAGSSKKDYSVWLPSSTLASDESEEDSEDDARVEPLTPTRPSAHRRTSSVPSTDLPSIPKARSASQTATADRQRDDVQSPTSPVAKTFEDMGLPSSAPGKLQKRQKSSSEKQSPKPSPESPTKKRFSIPSFTPNFLKKHRRSSSPLKHQYEPSIITDSSSDSFYSDDDDLDSVTSESSEDEDQLGELKSPGVDSVNEFAKATPPDSVASLPANTLSPSQSASQAPYRTVPQQAGGASRTVASISTWSDRGAWEPLHPHDCCIVVTPGLIEAFDLSVVPAISPEDGDDASPSARGIQPLVAFELTPLVPLRRGTALDISIRSPPTVNSQIQSSANVMLRSRSVEECEGLYTMINLARINNPTYVALQNARGPFNESTWAAAMDRRNSNRNAKSSWWNLPSRKNSTYRSKASRPQSVATDSSIGTMNSAFSALRRFGGANHAFNISKSTVTSAQGSRSTASGSLSSGSSTPITIDPSQGTPLGITNAKIRLHYRESPTKWRDMGSARLTIMLPPRPSPGAPASPRTTGQEKRILIKGKTRDETLLDVTLGESCFERVARTGIAISVWEDNMGPNGEVGHVAASGGVGSSRVRTYMLQMKSERDCAYTFSLVGKLRY